ncbi:GntR family transcriptional regulator [Paenibacillus sp. P26]|nr:GntR family transcriptional regulator [Paenibacillus sp. P26]
MDLAKKYSVARITIRKAINELVQDHLLVRRAGKGTFVSEPKIERELVSVAGFTERLQSRGIKAGAKTIEVNRMKSDAKLAGLLRIPQGAEIVEIARLRLIHEVPVALERSYIPLSLCPDIDKESFDNNSLYLLLENKYSLRPYHSSKTLELTRATNKEAKWLQVSKGSPLFLMMATVFTEDNTVMEYVKTLFIGERFRFQVY